MQKKILFLIIASFSFAFLSCVKEDKQAGLEIQPDENRLTIFYQGLDGFTTYTSKSDPVKTHKGNTSVLLGSINDETFGRTSAFFVSQYRLSSDNVDFGNDPQIVSAKAYLDINGADGDSSHTSRFKIYESQFEIDPDSSYVSNTNMNYPTGSVVALLDFDADSFNIMQIPLLNSFGQKILSADSATLANNDNFLEKFKGLYFTVDTNQIGSGLMWKYDLSSAHSYIELEYTNADSLGAVITDTTGAPIINTFKLQFNDNCGRFNLYYNDLSPLEGVFDQPLNKLYISGTAGPKGHINLSPILTWRDSAKLVVYKAELVVKAEQSNDDFPIPTKLLMEINDSDEETVRFVDDYLPSSSNNYGGNYDSETGSYSMVITRHIQNLINSNHNDTLLWISPSGNLTNPYRVILYNGENNENITLKISYSKLY